MRWLGPALIATAILAACDADQDPFGPTGTETPVQLEVVDGANNGGASGFFFLPPLAKYVPATGEFDARRAPGVEVCELRKGSCRGLPIARFTMSDGPRDRAIRAFPLPIAFRINSGAVQAAPPPPWPNEPAGLTVMTDQPRDALGSLGWRHLDRMSTSHVTSDGTAPMSPANAFEHVFPVGYAGGYAPGVDYYSLYPLPEARELFVGVWFKASDPWQGAYSGFNVLQYVVLSGGGHVTVPMYGPKSGPFEIRVVEGWSGGALLPSNLASARVTPGSWHRLELYLRYDSAPGAGNGVIRWWLDGNLVGDYEDRSFPSGNGFLEYQIAPNWGGVGDTKTQADWLRFDHTFISGN